MVPGTFDTSLSQTGNQVNAGLFDLLGRRFTNIKRCDKTFRADVGYSTYISLDGKPVVIGSLDGKTDGTPPLSVHYKVRDAGQHFVWVDL